MKERAFADFAPIASTSFCAGEVLQAFRLLLAVEGNDDELLGRSSVPRTYFIGADNNFCTKCIVGWPCFGEKCFEEIGVADFANVDNSVRSRPFSLCVQPANRHGTQTHWRSARRAA